MTKEPKYVFLLKEENFFETEPKKFYVDAYSTEEVAKKQMKKEVEDSMQQNESEITEGSIEELYVVLEDPSGGQYVFEIEKQIVKDETWV